MADPVEPRALFQPVTPVRAYERIVSQVEEALYAGRLVPGQRLPSERELMAQFGVSRATVREALRVLESQGIVRSRPGDPAGPLVLPTSTEVLHRSMQRLARLDGLGLGELLAFRMVIEGSANLLAARLRTDGQLAEMEAAAAAMRTALDEGYDAFSRADVAFHDAVARATGNRLLQVCGDVVREVVLGQIADKIVQAPDSRALMLESLQHHDAVLDAVRRGDGQRAAFLARANLFDYYGGYLDEAEREGIAHLVDD